MAKIWRTPFAATGDKTAIPDATQPDGSVSNGTGWGPDYQRPYTVASAKDIDRAKMNWIFGQVTEGLGEIQLQGAPSWSADAAPYPIYATVYHSGVRYVSLISNNSAIPGSADSGWNVDRSGGALIGVRRFTTNGIYTPTDGTRAVVVTVVGGGGGSGGVAASSVSGAGATSGGGGGGGSASSYLNSGFAGVSITIGSGGSAGTSGGGSGGQGGTTSFGSLLSATGGIGGAGSISQTGLVVSWSGIGGDGVSGNIWNAGGIPGAIGISSGSQFVGSGGGMSKFSSSVPGSGAGAAAIAGSLYGGGAGGCSSNTNSSPAARPGAAGAQGVVFVFEYS